MLPDWRPGTGEAGLVIEQENNPVRENHFPRQPSLAPTGPLRKVRTGEQGKSHYIH